MRRTRLAFALFLAVACVPAVAQDSTDPDRRPDERTVMTSEAFLGGHPDLKYRLSGLSWHGQQNYTRALEDFRRAARYADKPAQGMLAEMYWTGQGVEADRAVAYAWMDIAAERGYPVFLGKREQFWNELDESERARAIEVGVAMMDEFGDHAAKPRLERELNKARRNTTGSRVGSVGNLIIRIPTPHGTQEVRGDTYYAEKFWEPEQYWRWTDYDWKKPAEGEVTVGDVVTDNGPPPEED